MVQEYLGSTLTNAAIQFVPPSRLGLTEERLTDSVAICARLGSGEVPVDAGWLIHQVRQTLQGSAMCSRFWLGGRHIATCWSIARRR
jgi:DAPG hydrolase PhiG domain